VWLASLLLFGFVDWKRRYDSRFRKRFEILFTAIFISKFFNDESSINNLQDSGALLNAELFF
jgi:hypothetical protein